MPGIILSLRYTMEKKWVVAVFENDALNRFIYQRMLNLQSEVVTAYIFENPEAGVELAQSVKFDLAFIDLHLRGELFGGVSLATQLQSLVKDIRLVAMTTLIQEADREQSQKEGFVALLEKPVPFYNFPQLMADIEGKLK